MSSRYNRRSFLIKSTTSCSLCFLAVPNILGSSDKLTLQNEKHKFQTDSGMTMQEVYNLAYTESYIPAMKSLMKQVGKKKFLEMLKISSDMVYQVDNENEIDYSTRTLEAWSESMKTAIKNRMTKRLSYEIITDNPELLEIKFTECLWAKTFKEADAADIGYAGFCYRDYSC
ncbi:hypothetical protein OU798_24330 [Prolixibacteraceae bacterium Z1-6]|uniref:Uncharacterized protein n=1 Tax=Draconibacterium aestuarii TaxID=2998507 RepID=A0A9X3FAF4_9BACT|nr:hypothetical protein [Prolixibacteraceae bacterium Z1-6]